jgi:hypothetical protein
MFSTEMTIIKYFSFQALVGQLVTLPRLLKDDKRYTVTVETVSSEKFHSQKRATSHFRADEYYKYLEITISKQVSLTIFKSSHNCFACNIFKKFILKTK